MTQFEQVVKTIKEDYKQDCKDYDCTIREFFKIMQYSKKDLVEEFYYILKQANLDKHIYDDGDFHLDGKIVPFAQVKRAICK